MRRAGIRRWGHSGHVSRFEDKDSSRSGATALGCDVDNNGNGRVGDLLDDAARGSDQAARRVEFDQHSLRMGGVRFRQSAADELVGDGLDGVVDDDLENLRGLGCEDGKRKD